WVWNRQFTQTVGSALAAAGITVPVATNPEDLNGEAIGFHGTGLGYYTVSEGWPTTNNFFRRTDSGVPRQPVVFIKPGDVWRYEDSGEDAGTAWRQTAFNDTAWST